MVLKWRNPEERVWPSLQNMLHRLRHATLMAREDTCFTSVRLVLNVHCAKFPPPSRPFYPYFFRAVSSLVPWQYLLLMHGTERQYCETFWRWLAGLSQCASDQCTKLESRHWALNRSLQCGPRERLFYPPNVAKSPAQLHLTAPQFRMNAPTQASIYWLTYKHICLYVMRSPLGHGYCHLQSDRTLSHGGHCVLRGRSCGNSVRLSGWQ